MANRGHYLHYCQPCTRRFPNANQLKMHLHSRKHRGTTVPCPFCKTNYTTASGLAHHLEMGACAKAPTLNRDTIHRIIRERDPGGVITNRQLEWYPESETVRYTATDRAWNGRAWECYLCHRGFGTPTALNAHLNSPAHKQKVYHCPNARGVCGREFVSLAALFNHLESESCEFMRFEKVQTHVGNVLRGQNLIAF